jgi:molybdopterin/thiamine biosynthesis adenylyltransferase
MKDIINGLKYFDIVQRNIGIFTKEEQLKLKNSTVLITGTGGIGGPLAEVLVRMGIGKLILAEFDSYSVSNLNRQLPSTVEDIGKHKAKVLASHLKKIHPYSEIVVIPEGVTKNNIDKLVKQSDVVLQLMDSAMTMVLQEALKRNNKIGFTSVPLLNEIIFVSFPPKGTYFRDIYPYEIDEKNIDKSNDDYRTFAEVMSKKKLLVNDYFPVICAGTFVSTGMLAYQVAYYLVGEKIIFPAFPAHALLDTHKMKLYVKYKYLKYFYNTILSVSFVKRLILRSIKRKIERKIKKSVHKNCLT